MQVYNFFFEKNINLNLMNYYNLKANLIQIVPEEIFLSLSKRTSEHRLINFPSISRFLKI